MKRIVLAIIITLVISSPACADFQIWQLNFSWYPTITGTGGGGGGTGYIVPGGNYYLLSNGNTYTPSGS